MKQVDQDIFRHRAEELSDAAKRVIEEYGSEKMSERLRQLDQKRRRFEEVR